MNKIMKLDDSALFPRPTPALARHETAPGPSRNGIKVAREDDGGKRGSSDPCRPLGDISNFRRRRLFALAASCWEMGIYFFTLLADLILVGLLVWCFIQIIAIKQCYPPKNRELLIPRYH